MKIIPNFCFLLIAVLTLSPAWAAQPKYKTFYVFGDSLSDTGNDLILTKRQKINPPIPPSERPHRSHFKGRFSNGPVAVEYLWDLLEKKQKHLIPFLSVKHISSSEAISFAFGGSKSGYLNQMPGDIYVPGTLGQVDLFRKALKGKKPKADSLFVIWTGANDYLLGEPAEPIEVVENITKAIEILHSLGARNFLIPNLPDLGLTPLAQQNNLGEQFLALTQAHNALLAQALDEVSRLPEINVMGVDLFAVSQALLDPEKKIITSPPAITAITDRLDAATCFFVAPSTCPDVDFTSAPGFAFWDVLHPTTFIHQLYGQAMFEALDPKK